MVCTFDERDQLLPRRTGEIDELRRGAAKLRDRRSSVAEAGVGSPSGRKRRRTTAVSVSPPPTKPPRPSAASERMTGMRVGSMEPPCANVRSRRPDRPRRSTWFATDTSIVPCSVSSTNPPVNQYSKSAGQGVNVCETAPPTPKLLSIVPDSK